MHRRRKTGFDKYLDAQLADDRFKRAYDPERRKLSEPTRRPSRESARATQSTPAREVRVAVVRSEGFSVAAARGDAAQRAGASVPRGRGASRARRPAWDDQSKSEGSVMKVPAATSQARKENGREALRRRLSGVR